MNWIDDLFLSNPMMHEAKRFRRRFFGSRGASSVFVLIISILCYLLLVGLTMAFPDMPPQIVIYAQIVIYCILIPSMMHGSIAGEREKRTWESLLAAPISPAQIVVGKYCGAVFAILAIAVLMSFPLGIAVLNNLMGRHQFYSHESLDMSVPRFVLAELIAVTFAMALASWCVLISARSKRAFAAQGVIYGTLLMALVVWPILTSIASSGSRIFVSALCALHPLMDVAYIFENSSSEAIYNPMAIGVFAVFAFICAAILFLVWADRTLRFADESPNFIPRSKRASH